MKTDFSLVLHCNMRYLLSKYFQGIGVKRLSDVEIKPQISNQHEFNGITAFKGILGTSRKTFKGHFIYLSDEEENIIEDYGNLTWYDARENHPTRSEFRLYYTTNHIIEAATVEDLILIGTIDEYKLVVIIAPKDSTSERQLLWLFGLSEIGTRFIVKDLLNEDVELNFAGKYIIKSLGFDIPEEEQFFADDLIYKFNSDFPSSTVFSSYARSTFTNLVIDDNPDITILAWLNREELLFKTLEKSIVEKKLDRGFGSGAEPVEDFIKFSLSVLNRRKVRAGLAFENHLSFLFDLEKISYSHTATTERRNKPDFIFPGITQYRNISFDDDKLTMLGVKTTAKDRWRQILSEADRVNIKHLVTLEPAISKNQTDEMNSQNVQLVVPQPILETYSPDQQRKIMNIGDFLRLVKDRQKAIS